MATADDAPDDDKAPKLRYTDEELLGFVREERKRSIGFGEGDSGELTTAREKALDYAKGEMNDVPSLPNRSKAVDSTVADAVETVLPDLMEVFIGGDDVATFIPQGEEDEEQARDESDYINHAVFAENEGFLTLYTAFKDALLVRTGLIHWYPEDYEKEHTAAQVPAEMADQVQAVGQQQGMELSPETQEDGSVALKQTTKRLKVCIRAVPPEDFSVAPDTVSLREATYCVMRDRPRVQDLIARGVDPTVARDLKSYVLRNDAIEQARDEAGEHNTPQDGTTNDLRIVEVRAHYLRIDADDDGDTEIWRIVTDAEEGVLIEKEQVGQIPFAAFTPYIVPHRFYGESVADKLIEVQKIKTVLLRMLLDSGYFALNQRNYVDMNKVNEFTIADLLANEPGRPVRGNGEGAVLPLSAGALSFDVFSAMEFVSTMAEGRSGIVRNAQGLNPDTLHDTAKGAMALISAAQKRVRLIARIFAETGVKDLFLGVHAMLRASYSSDHSPMQARIGSAWKSIDPSAWPEREAMAIHVGVGSAGKEHDLLVANQRMEIIERLLPMPGAMGTLVDSSNIHQSLLAWERAAGTKAPEIYWTDPKSPQAQQAQQQQAQKPDPAMAEIQGKLQIEQARVQAKQQGDAQAAQMDMQLQAAKHQAQMQQDAAHAASQLDLQREKMAQEHQQKMYQIAQELQLRREIAAEELALKREVAMAQAHSAHAVGMAKVEAGSVQEPQPGGEPG